MISLRRRFLAGVSILWLAGPGLPEAGASSQSSEPTRTKQATAAVIDGVPCDAGYVWRFPDGQLHRCTIDRGTIVRGAPLPKGSTVAFKPDGDFHYVFLPATTEIEGYRCRGSGHHYMTSFHPNGRLKLCWFPEDREVHGVPCAGFSFWSDAVLQRPSGVYFHPDGTLAGCRVSRDVTIDGALFRKGSRVSLDPQGHPAGPAGRTSVER